MTRFALTAVAFLFAAGCRTVEPPPAPAPAQGSEWITLFDGRTLDGWKASEHADSWKIVDGELVAHGPRSHLFYVGDGTDNVFRDFEFCAEVMATPGSNSGLYFHTQYQQEGWPSHGFEAQVNNTQTKDPRRTGSLYGIEDIHAQLIQDNTWWEQRVLVLGSRVIIKVNGKVVVDYTQPEDTGDKPKLSEGTFALQAHDPDSEVHFRNVRARRLLPGDPAVPPPPPTSADDIREDPFDALCTYRFGESRLAAAAVEKRMLNATADERAAGELRLVAALNAPGTTANARHAICRLLSRFGSESAVPAVAANLSDSDVSHMARYALERIGGTAACAALRNALPALTGKQLIGAAAAVGRLRDHDAVPYLVGLLDSPQPDVAAATAKALGEIGGADAVAALQEALADERPAHKAALYDALLRCAERAATDQDDQQTALALYQELNRDTRPALIRTAALDGLVRLRGADAVPLLTDMLRSPDPETQATAAQYVRDIDVAQAAETFAGQLVSLQPPAQIALLSALRDRGDQTAKPAVTNALESADADVRTAAVAALRKLGDATDVEVLALAAAGARGPEQDSICDAIAALEGEDVDAAILGASEHEKAGVRAVAIRAAARRNIPGAGDAVLRRIIDQNRQVRKIAFDTLPGFVGPDAFPALLSCLVATESAVDRENVSTALAAVCLAQDDADAAVASLMCAAITATDVPVRAALLRTLGRTGHQAALPLVSAALEDPRADVQEAGVRALCDWPDPRALPKLVEFVQQTDSPLLSVLALRGALRLLGMPHDRTAEQDLDIYATLMGAADRPDEKRLVLGGLAELRSVEAMDLVTPCLADPGTVTEAALALATLAGNTVGVDRVRAEAAAAQAAEASDNPTVRQRANAARKAVEAIKDHIVDWQVAGPYTKHKVRCDQLVGTPFAVETRDGTPVEWRLMPVCTDPDRPWYMDLKEFIGGNDRAAYMKTYVFAPTSQQALLALGSDDAVKAWLNRRHVHTHIAHRGASPGQDKVPVELHRGWNEVLMKIVNGGGDWGACARVLSPDGKKLPAVQSRAELGKAEQEQLVTSPPAELILSWSMDEPGDPTLSCTGLRGGRGLLKGGASRTPGARGNAVRFDGKDGLARSEEIPGLPIDAAAAWSLNMFVFVDEQPGELSIIGGFGDVVTGKPVGCQRYLVKYKNGIHFWGSSVDVNPGVPFDVGRWQMITITYDGELLTIYKDGKELIASEEKLVDAAPVVRLAPPPHWNNGSRFAGAVDEFSVWSGVLTQQQIDQLAEQLDITQ